jgi:hypothetical protein
MATKVITTKTQVEFSPKNQEIDNWLFIANKDGISTEDFYGDINHARLECELADAIANVGEANGLDTGAYQHIVPVVLRLLKSNSPWSI